MARIAIREEISLRYVHSTRWAALRWCRFHPSGHPACVRRRTQSRGGHDADRLAMPPIAGRRRARSRAADAALVQLHEPSKSLAAADESQLLTATLWEALSAGGLAPDIVSLESEVFGLTSSLCREARPAVEFRWLGEVLACVGPPPPATHHRCRQSTQGDGPCNTDTRREEKERHMRFCK